MEAGDGNSSRLGGDGKAGSDGPAREQRAAAARQWGRGVGAGDRIARGVRGGGALGARLAYAEPPLRRAGADGGGDLGRSRARDRSRARNRQLLPAPGRTRKVIATENLRAPWGRRLLGLALAAGIAWLGLVAQPTPARAGVPNVVGVGCNLAGDFIDGFAGKAAGIAGAAVAVLGGARAALSEAARILGRTTAPHLTSAWFSAAYWRVAALAAVLTLPFLF